MPRMEIELISNNPNITAAEVPTSVDASSNLLPGENDTPEPVDNSNQQTDPDPNSNRFGKINTDFFVLYNSFHISIKMQFSLQ